MATAGTYDYTRQRAAKAATLAVALYRLGATPEDVLAFTAEDRRMAEKAAPVRKASDETWRLTLDMLAGSARREALCPFCGRGDPEGIVGPPQRIFHDGPCSQ